MYIIISESVLQKNPTNSRAFSPKETSKFREPTYDGPLWRPAMSKVLIYTCMYIYLYISLSLTQFSSHYIFHIQHIFFQISSHASSAVTKKWHVLFLTMVLSHVSHVVTFSPLAHMFTAHTAHITHQLLSPLKNQNKARIFRRPNSNARLLLNQHAKWIELRSRKTPAELINDQTWRCPTSCIIFLGLFWHVCRALLVHMINTPTEWNHSYWIESQSAKTPTELSCAHRKRPLNQGTVTENGQWMSHGHGGRHGIQSWYAEDSGFS